MKNIIYWIILIGCFCISIASLQAQDSTKVLYWQVVTKDSSTYTGIILKETDQILRLETQKSGIVSIQQIDILYKRQIEQSILIKDRSANTDPLATYYFLRPSALPLHKGEGFYRNVWGIYNQVQVGLTDFFSMGGSVLLLPFTGISVLPAWVSLDFSIPTKNENFRLGTGLYVGSFFISPYFQGTWGDREQHITVGGSYIPFTFELDEGGLAILSLSASKRIGKRSYLVTDNYALFFLGEATVNSSFFWRYAGAVGVDLGLTLGFADGDVGAAPILSLHIPFGRKRGR